MTCIVAISNGENVFMASDRGLSDDDVITSMSAPKIRINDKYLIGYADSPGTGQLIHWITLPTPPRRNVEKFMRTTWVSAVRKALADSGVDLKEGAHASFLVGVSGQLFFVDTQDWQVTECEYMSIGSGSSIAMGSLYTTQTWKSAEKRAFTAVSAAIELSPSCKGPVDSLYN
jgi:ATP-dependent protease HslVU (ClpYQ) peptidase subunit